MASTQPLTQSTLPTAEELKIETPINEIQTAPGVTLNDHKSLLVASVLDLFAGKPSLRKLSLWKPDAIFKDPLTTAEGHKQYAAQWYGLAAGFSEITRLSHTVTSAGNPITLDLKTKYVVKGIGAEKTVASIVEIWVDENGSGKIEKVQDKWDGEINEGPFKQALRKMNAVGVPIMVSVPKSIEEEEGKKK